MRIHGSLFVFARSHFGLGSAPHFLLSVLPLLALLSARFLHLEHPVPGLPVLGFKPLGILQGVVDEAEACRLAPTELCAESETEDDVGGGLVHARQLFSDLCFRHSGPSWVEHIYNHLLSVEQTVGQELASADCRRWVTHVC